MHTLFSPKKILFLLIPTLISLFFPYLAFAQTTDSCRNDSPIMVMRHIPIQNADHLKTLSQHFVSLITTKQHILVHKSEDELAEEKDEDDTVFTSDPWFNLQHTFSKEIKLSPASVSAGTLLTTRPGCLHTLSPTSLTFGLDLVNTESPISFILGAFGSYTDNKSTLTSLDAQENTDNNAFPSFVIENNALRYGIYAALHGDASYGFISYTQNDTPISLAPQGGEKITFADGSFGSIGGGFGTVIDAGLLFGFHLNVQQLSFPTNNVSVDYNSSLTQNYTAITPNWFTSEVRTDVGYAFTDEENSTGRVSFYTSALTITNFGDDSFSALGDQSLNNLIQQIQRFFTTTGVSLNDTMIHSTIGVLASYGNPYGLKGEFEIGYSRSIHEGASVDHSGTFIKLNLNYRI